MNRRWIVRTGWSALALLLLALMALMCWEPFLAEQPGPPPPPRAYAAEIVRDSFGVPHIYGRSDADVTFGVAMAHAEDDFSTLQDVLAMTRGRYGAIAGEPGAGVDYAYHLFGVRAKVRHLYPALPADVRDLLDGYAAGLNRFASLHPREVKLANLFPVNGEDIAAGFALRLPFFSGMDRVLKPLVDGAPANPEFGPALDGKPLPGFFQGGGDIEPRLGRQASSIAVPGRDEGGSPDGSNAFAIAPKRSGDGVTRLVSNTHQPWRGPVAWYELVIESDAGWHFAGATFPGSPWPFLGHNDDLGWTNTIDRPDLVDVYKLVLSMDATQYRLDGKWLPLERRRVWLPVKLGPFVLPVPRTIARSAHGPVVENAHGAFALRYAGIETIDALIQYYRLTRARSFAEWQAAMAIQGVPATNFVYADRSGTIAHVYNGRFPVRKPGFDWRHVLPGDRSDLIWQAHVPWSGVPQNINPASGFLFSANNTPFVAAGPGSELDPAHFSPLLGIELDMTNRARRAVKLLAASPHIGRAELERIKYDTGVERAGFVAQTFDAVAALDTRGDPLLARAQKLLANWDYRLDGQGPGDALATMMIKPMMSAAYNHRRPPDVRRLLHDSAWHLQHWFGRLDPPLGEVVRLRQGSVDLPMDGGETLRAASDWDVDPRDGRLVVKHGDSFLMFMEWPAGGAVRSQSIVPFGAATTRPQSPHYADQSPLFAAHRLKPVYFRRADVLAHAASREVVTGGQ
ncbi:MAG: penicillin acylase family protein [Sphingomonadales bacterium]|nr:penicillin acylase family protein [Sphingomonadales bacterium]